MKIIQFTFGLPSLQARVLGLGSWGSGWTRARWLKQADCPGGQPERGSTVGCGGARRTGVLLYISGG